MSVPTKDLILQKTAKLFALHGYEGFSMRTIAKEIPLAQSVLYHYFPDKDTLLRTMFDTLNTQLGEKRAALKQPKTASDMLKQRIHFQFDNAEAIVAVLKYYIAYRDTFPKFKHGYVPDKTSLHIEEVLQYGMLQEEFQLDDMIQDARVITHAINGFLLEYYPLIPLGKEKETLVAAIHSFIMRALQKGGENNGKS